MGFEEELSEIVGRMLEGSDEDADQDAMSTVLGILRDKDTHGYLVFIGKEGQNGIVCLGPAKEVERLSYAHRIADGLINDIIRGYEADA